MIGSEYGHICVANSKKELFPRLIKWVTRSQFSHSFIIAPSMLGKEMVIEAADSGVAMCSFDDHYRNDPDQGYRVYRFRADPALKDQAMITLFTELQTRYGYLELPWFAWRALNLLFGRDIRHQDNWSQDGTICSELAAQYISMSGFPQFLSGFGRGSVNAQDIFEICEAHPEVFELVEFKE